MKGAQCLGVVPVLAPTPDPTQQTKVLGALSMGTVTTNISQPLFLSGTQWLCSQHRRQGMLTAELGLVRDILSCNEAAWQWLFISAAVTTQPSQA